MQLNENEIEYILSNNYDNRLTDMKVDLLVIHCISLPPENFGDDHIIDFFTNKLDPSLHPYFKEISDLKVSSHFLIRRYGNVISFVPMSKRAWHAGDLTAFAATAIPRKPQPSVVGWAHPKPSGKFCGYRHCDPRRCRGGSREVDRGQDARGDPRKAYLRRQQG